MNEEPKSKSDQDKAEWDDFRKQMSEWVELKDSWTRKRFDYQERWHGWQSPVGLGLGTLLVSLSALVITMAWSNLIR